MCRGLLVPGTTGNLGVSKTLFSRSSARGQGVHMPFEQNRRQRAVITARGCFLRHGKVCWVETQAEGRRGGRRAADPCQREGIACAKVLRKEGSGDVAGDKESQQGCSPEQEMQGTDQPCRVHRAGGGAGSLFWKSSKQETTKHIVKNTPVVAAERRSRSKQNIRRFCGNAGEDG